MEGKLSVSFEVKAIKLGATIEAMGETEYLLTDGEIDAAAERIRVELDKAVERAKAGIRIERAKDAYF